MVGRQPCDSLGRRRWPWPHDDKFIVGFKMDVTNKPSGQRMTMEEMGLYTVKNGKIVSEAFFYSGG